MSVVAYLAGMVTGLLLAPVMEVAVWLYKSKHAGKWAEIEADKLMERLEASMKMPLSSRSTDTSAKATRH